MINLCRFHNLFIELIIKNLASEDYRLKNGAIDLLKLQLEMFAFNNELAYRSVSVFVNPIISLLVKSFDSLKSYFSLFIYDEINVLVEKLVDIHMINIQKYHNSNMNNNDNNNNINNNNQIEKTYIEFFQFNTEDKNTLTNCSPLITVFKNCENFFNRPGIALAKNLYNKMKLVEVDYIITWMKQILKMVSGEKLNSLFYSNINNNSNNIYNLLEEQYFVLDILTFIQNKSSDAHLQEFYLQSFDNIKKYLDHVIGNCKKVLSKFEKEIRSIELKKLYSKLINNKGDFDSALNKQSHELQYAIEDVPNNIITGVFFDTYNINLRIAIQVILKVYKFYFKLLRFIDSDKMTRTMNNTNNPNNNTNNISNESIPRTNSQNFLFTNEIVKFKKVIVENCKSFKEMHKYTFPTLFGNILKRLNKFQKYVKDDRIKKEFQKMLCAIFQECISTKESLNYSIYWEKMVYVFEKLGNPFIQY